MSTRIFQGKDEIRFEVTDTVHVHCHRSPKDRPYPVVTIEETDEEEIDPNEPGVVLIRWSDIDRLIESLQELKGAL